MKKSSRRQFLGILAELTVLGLAPNIAKADDDDSGDSDTGGEGSAAECAHEQAENFHSKDTVQSEANGNRSLTQNEALLAVQKGLAVSLPDLLNHVAKNYPGDLLDVRLRKRHDQYFYFIKYLENSTNLHMIELEAKTLKALEAPCAY